MHCLYKTQHPPLNFGLDELVQVKLKLRCVFQAVQHPGAQVVPQRRGLRLQQEGGDHQDGWTERQGRQEDLHL